MLASNHLLASIFDEKVVTVIGTILTKPDDFGVREIARESEVSTATTYRIIQRLKNLRIITRLKQGKSITYKVDKNNSIYAQLYELVLGPVAKPIDILKQILNDKVGEGNYNLIARGSGKEQKIFVVSDGITSVINNDIIKEVSQRTTSLPFVCISKLQYKQMKEFGII